MSASLWRHQNAAMWRAVRKVLGPWRKAARTFIRWSKLGVWKRLLILVQTNRAKPGMTFLDGTNIRAHQKAAGAAKEDTTIRRDDREVLGRSRGGFGTKACVITEPIGRAVAFVLARGQDHELPHAIPLLDKLPGVPNSVVADRGYSRHAFREHVCSVGAHPAIPTHPNEKTLSRPSWIYTNRDQIERLWARLKEWRAIATRHAKTARSLMGVLRLAATCDRIKGAEILARRPVRC